jgi:uncharacterized membrane protein (UPF0127 family)
MRIVIFDTPEGKAQGLQHLTAIEPGILFLFTGIPPGTGFHSRNVPEPFDIAFIAEDRTILALKRMYPPHDLAEAPPGCAMAVEAKAGWLPHWGFFPGWRTVSF